MIVLALSVFTKAPVASTGSIGLPAGSSMKYDENLMKQDVS